MAAAHAEPDVCLTVFMEGTSNSLESKVTQIGLFAELASGLDVTDMNVKIPAGAPHLKMAYDGCGVSHGFTGLVFGNGLIEQGGQVKQRVSELLRMGYKQVRLNAVGLSRGGIGCIYLTQAFSAEVAFANSVHMNVLLFDPVPGNARTMVNYMDMFSWSNASKCMDMSECGNVRRLLAIYPHEPLPDVALHAPVVPRYPPGCVLEEEVSLGCHQGALFCAARIPACVASFYRIQRWLLECGCPLERCPGMEVEERTLLRLYGEALRTDEPTTRHAHSLEGATVVRHPRGKWLNLHHRQLTEKLQGQDVGSADGEGLPTYMLEVTRTA